MALRPCAQPGCPTLVPVGRCDVHKPKWLKWMSDPVGMRAYEARRRASAPPWRRLYHTQRWADLRMSVLTTDPTCRACAADGYVTASTDADHIVPHRGNLELFWDRANLQGLCASCHAKKTQRGE